MGEAAVMRTFVQRWDCHAVLLAPASTGALGFVHDISDAAPVPGAVSPGFRAVALNAGWVAVADC